MNIFKKSTIIFITLCLIFFCGCEHSEPIEDLAVIMGFGYDIEKKSKPKNITAMEFITVEKKDEASSDYFVGKGTSIYNAIENYKSKQEKPFSYGSELVYIISEERAKLGMEDLAYDLLSYPDVNINAKTIICKGECKDYFSLKLKSGSASEKLSNLIKFENEEHFFSECYKVNDFLCMYYQQGRQLYLPYVEIIKKNFQVTGVAIFNNNKFYKKIPIEEAKLMNILRNSGGTGIIGIYSDDPFKYLEMEGESNLKVKVSTKNHKLNYDISISVSGDLRIDTLYGKELSKKQILKIEKKLEDKFKKDLDKEVKKIQNVYGFDCLDLSKYALAEYGRNSGYDSDEYFSNAKINIDVKVKIESTGRTYKGTAKN